MGFHLLAYTKSVAAGSTNEDIPGVTDGYATLSNNHYVLQRDFRLRYAFAMGANISTARLNVPALRSISLPHITPLEVGSSVSDVPAIADFGSFMPVIPRIDEIAVETSNTGAAAERHIVGLWVVDPQARPALPGPVFTVRGTAAITSGNLSWGEGTFTLESTLPAGRYQVVGLDVIGANLVFARLRFPEQTMLPGVLARTSQANRPDENFRVGRSGLFGEFESTAPPLLQVFGTAAPTTQVVYLDLVKVH
jgi:hypothetical protein